MNFQKQILMDQRQHVLDQFQQVSIQWQQAKEKMSNNVEVTLNAFMTKDKHACKLEKVTFEHNIKIMNRS